MERVATRGRHGDGMLCVCVCAFPRSWCVSFSICVYVCVRAFPIVCVRERVVGSRVSVDGSRGVGGCVLGARVSEGEARDSAAAVYNSGSSVALATFRVQYLSFFFFFFLKQFFRFPRLPINNNYNIHTMFRTISIAL